MLTLVQVGSLGLPGTRWAENEILDVNTQAHGLSKLLWELMERGEISVDSLSCIVIMGIGFGANAVLHFEGTSFRDSRFRRLRDATRFFTLVNPFPPWPMTRSESQSIKQSLQTLRKVLARGVYHEQLQCLISTLFSTEYLEKVSAS